jgi:hypothetical protein
MARPVELGHNDLLFFLDRKSPQAEIGDGTPATTDFKTI